MKKILFTLFVSLIFTISYSQNTFTVLGKVLDSANKQPLAGASVFLSEYHTRHSFQ